LGVGWNGPTAKRNFSWAPAGESADTQIAIRAVVRAVRRSSFRRISWAPLIDIKSALAAVIRVLDFWMKPRRNEGAFYLAAARPRRIRLRIRRIPRTKITSRLVRVYLERTERKFDRGKVSGTAVRVDPMLRGDFNVAAIHRFARRALRRVAPTESRGLCV